ncbi:MAG: RnfABCDGE type electron transport complex subunit B [Firmicutes bacterium]|nr:RnfABCDGE type electron transport complex subunit B [Bacillota bacterium]
MNEVLVAVSVLGGMGAVFGISLSYAAKIFTVELDEKVIRIRETLPGANCGVCGFTGCDAFAGAVAAGKAEANGCPVGNDEMAAKIAEIIGVKTGKIKKSTARILCNGQCDVSAIKYSYHGMESCFAAALIFGGHKSCTHGCLGFGDCVKSCPFYAIVIKNGIAKVIENRCRACGKCIPACPKRLIQMIPIDKKYGVICSSMDKGAVVLKNCTAGCIGCMKCVKVCSCGAISVTDFLAKIDYEECVNCGECFRVCPAKAIKEF